MVNVDLDERFLGAREEGEVFGTSRGHRAVSLVLEGGSSPVYLPWAARPPSGQRRMAVV